jgi:uncharacterized DUF497 family protein
MEIEFDPAKNARNIAERQLSFEMVAEFDWTSAVIAEDTRRDYGERRYEAVGKIRDRLHVLIFTPRIGTIRIISLRRANERERKRYGA